MGRPWPKPGEPMWLDDDADKVAAWLAAKHEVCPRCGTTESDWIDQATGRFLDQPKWEATSFRCHGCAEVERAVSAIPEGEKGVRVVLVPMKDEGE